MSTTSSESNELLSTREAADVLGISEAVVRRRVRDGEFGTVNEKGSIRLYRSEVEAAAASRDRLGQASAVSHDPVALVEQISGIRVAELPLLLSPEQVANILGCPRSTIYTMLRAGELPYRMVGRTKRVPLPALVRWLTDHEAA